MGENHRLGGGVERQEEEKEEKERKDRCAMGCY
jgi:hypothetical protein